MWSKRATLYVCLLAGAALALAMANQMAGQNASTAVEAPSGHDNQPNGLTDQTTFTMDRGKFEQTEGSGDGLRPIFNVQSCRECHQNPVTGSTSQVKELRAGHQDGFGNFVWATATLADGTDHHSQPLAHQPARHLSGRGHDHREWPVSDVQLSTDSGTGTHQHGRNDPCVPHLS